MSYSDRGTMPSFAAAIMWARMTIHTHSENRKRKIVSNCMYVCMYVMFICTVCINVCMYVRGRYMYVCTNGGFVVLWAHRCGNVYSAGTIASAQCNTLCRAVGDAWKFLSTRVIMYVCMHEIMYVCKYYVCMFVYSCMYMWKYVRN